MHPELKTFFETHAAKTCDHKRAVHDQMLDIVEVAASVEAHVRDLQHQLRKAMLAEHDHRLDSKLTYLKTRLRSADEAARRWLAEAESLAAALIEIEDAFRPATMEIAGLLALTAAPAEQPRDV